MAIRYIFDTNVYIRSVRDRSFGLQYADQYRRYVPSTFFSSVVAQELIVGCNDELAVRRIRALFQPFERVKRVINPSYNDWINAGVIAVRICLKRRDLISKKTALINDILISLSCHRIGARLITFNTRDFELIRVFVRFTYEEPKI